MKRALLFLITILIYLSIYAQENDKKKEGSLVNFGLKGGFNSSMYFVDDFKIKDVTIDKIQNNYKVGYFGAMFLRINMKRHFLQPEVLYTVSKSEIVFDKKGSQHPEIEPDYASINATIRTVEFPMLYGYNFVKSGPYGMCFFIGPKVKYIWKQKSKLSFGNFDQKGIQEELHPLNISGVFGVGVTISRIFFDFRYEVGLHNISKDVTYDNINESGEEEISSIVFKRRNNILSFSLGVIF